jgi:hypothetical protein
MIYLTQGHGFVAASEALLSIDVFERTLDSSLKAATIVVYGVCKKKASVDLNMVGDIKFTRQKPASQTGCSGSDNRIRAGSTATRLQ